MAVRLIVVHKLWFSATSPTRLSAGWVRSQGLLSGGCCGSGFKAPVVILTIHMDSGAFVDQALDLLQQIADFPSFAQSCR
jgi:hypothetical protein